MSPLVAYQGSSGRGQRGGGVLQPAAAAQRLLLDDRRHAQRQRRVAVQPLLEHLGEVAAGDDDVGDALGGQPGELVADDRGAGAGDLDHRLGPVVGVRAQPRALAAGQDHGLRGTRGQRLPCRGAGVMRHAARTLCGDRHA